MFENFRQHVKRLLKEKGMTYANLSTLTGIKESTIKCFMCGRDDSRRIAEKIADCFEMSLVYRSQTYAVLEAEEHRRNHN